MSQGWGGRDSSWAHGTFYFASGWGKGAAWGHDAVLPVCRTVGRHRIGSPTALASARIHWSTRVLSARSASRLTATRTAFQAHTPASAAPGGPAISPAV